MSLIVVDYLCDECGDMDERYETRGEVPDTVSCKCGGLGSRQFPCPMIGMPRVSAGSRAKADPRPPGAFDTRALVDEGISVGEWRKRRREERSKKDYIKTCDELGIRKIFSTAKAST